MRERFIKETAALILLIVLIGLFAFLQFSSGAFGSQPGDINSSGDQGTQLLFSWMVQNGYNVQVAESELVLDNTAVLFMMAPTEPLDFLEVERLNQWVFNGGTLILVQERGQAQRLLNRFDISSRQLLFSQQTAPFNVPTLNWPFVGEPELRSRAAYRVPCGEVAVHLGNCDEAHLAVFSWNAGQIVLLSSLYPVTNIGVQNPANARLVQNLIRLVTTPGETILVDQTHQGNGLLSWWRSRSGLALLLTAVLLLAYLLWQNQPLNAPVGRSAIIQDEPEALQTTSAFINHLARAQKELDPDRNVRDHFWKQLKRKFANRHGFDPLLDDETFFNRLRKVEDEETIGRLIYIMTSMAKPQIVDLEMMHWMSVTLDEMSLEQRAM